ncbi:MAG: hypothetical protein JWL70_3205 [Acidimicrobiia bacterium]|nr:hypothetical protein [Acidimicrobiia bacterium]
MIDGVMGEGKIPNSAAAAAAGAGSPDASEVAGHATAADLDTPADRCAGHRLIRASWITTGLFGAVTAVAVAWSGFEPVSVVVDLALFALGLVVFIAAFLAGVGRSRTDELDLPGWFFLLGPAAPRAVKRQLLGSFAAQVVVALASAGVRYPSVLAFGTLVPLLGLAWCGRWGARYGKFPPRVFEPRLRRNIEQNADHG